jgi:uncharacterized protein YaaR (DUF327 family)
MAELDAISQAQQYAGLMEQSRRLAQEKKQGQKAGAVNKSGGFQSLLETRAQAEFSAETAGIPGIDGLSFDEALVVLKDELDRAGDNLKAGTATENFIAYKAAVTHFMKFVVSNNYEMIKKKRRRPSIKWDDDYFHIVKVVDEKLDQLAAEVLSNHANKLAVLARIDEINGLLVDLIS